MKKTSYSPYLSLLLYFLYVTPVFTQQRDYFSINSFGKHAYSIDTTKLLVAFHPGISDSSKVILWRTSLLLEPYTPALELKQLGVSVIKLRPGITAEDVLDLLSQLNQNPSVRYASPFLRYKDGTLHGISHEINISLNSINDLDWLYDSCEKKGLTTPTRNEFDSLLYTVSVLDNHLGRALDIANELYLSGIPAYAEVNFLHILKRQSTDDPFQIAQWSQNNFGQYWNGSAWIADGDEDADMDVETAWNITRGDASIKIAVLDEGVDLDHPDLLGNLLPGYDATGLGSGGNPIGNDDHGTACAGMIVAVADNQIGIAGNAYQCKVIPVRIAYTPAGEDDWYTTDSWLTNAINWSWQNAGASILSNSWGGGAPSTMISNAITNAVNNGRSGKGSPVLFSAGNENETPVSYPSYYSNVISVGATSNCDERKSPTSCDGEDWWGSNYGTGLDVSAPGVWIATTDIAGSAGSGSGDYQIDFNGTSAACPNAASVMALILSVNPNLTQNEARQILEGTCDKVGGYTYSNNSNQPNGTWSSQLGYGRVNALAACIAATGYCPAFGNNTAEEWIASIQVGPFSKTSGNDLGYGYYTSLSAQLTQGTTYPVSLVPGYSGSQYSEYWRIWIDFNKDGDFADSGELVYDSGNAASGTENGTLNIPANAAIGATRMRIAMRYNEAPDPCSQFFFGEVEDFGVVISTGSGNTNGCSQATTINCGQTVSGTTSGSAQNLPECNGEPLNTAPGKWYDLTPAQSVSVTLTTCNTNSNYDTKIAVFSGSCTNLICVNANDDDDNCSTDDLLSTIEFTASAGQTYYIYVTGYEDNAGNFVLTTDCATPTCSIPGPDDFYHSNVTTNSVQLNITATGNLFQFRYKLSSSATWTQNAETTVIIDNITGLSPGSSYDYQLRRRCTNNVWSDWSATKTFTTNNPTQVPVTNFSASSTCGQAPLTVNFSDLSSNAPTSWTWAFGNGQTSTQQNPSAIYQQPGIYSVTLTATNAGGSDVETKTAYITVVGAVDIVYTPSNQACIGSPIQLQANGATNYIWSGNGLNTTSGQQVTAQPATSGTYTYTVTGSTNGCNSNPATVSLTFNPAPNVNLSASTTSACLGQGITLSASGATSYTWSGNGLNTTSGQQVTAQPTSAGTFTYSVTGNTDGCNSVPQSITIQFNAPSPQASVSPTGMVEICGSEIVMLTATGCANCNVLWSNGATTQTISVSAPGGSFTATYSNECGLGLASEATQVVVADFVPEITVNNQCYMAAPNGTNFQWYYNGAAINGANAQFFVATQTGYYTVSMTSTDGCDGTSVPLFIDGCATATNERPAVANLSVFPNPANRIVNFSFEIPSSTLLEITLTSIEGKILKCNQSARFEQGQYTLAIDISGLPNGVYLYRLVSEQGASLGKLMVSE